LISAFERLSATLDDAKNKGANVINLSGQEPQADTRKFPITLVLNASSDSLINNRETFGPILMVKAYEEPQEVITYINQMDCPLALYPFTHNKVLANLYINRIMSGGVAINDALFHVGQHDLPFGGAGASGIGHYHGYEGFLTFSKLRPVFYQAKFTLMKFLAPPYGKFADKMLHNLAKFKA
jgi:coniferyl-aldehyde dehydrogenase